MLCASRGSVGIDDCMGNWESRDEVLRHASNHSTTENLPISCLSQMEVSSYLHFTMCTVSQHFLSCTCSQVCLFGANHCWHFHAAECLDDISHPLSTSGLSTFDVLPDAVQRIAFSCLTRHGMALM